MNRTHQCRRVAAAVTVVLLGACGSDGEDAKDRQERLDEASRLAEEAEREMEESGDASDATEPGTKQTDATDGTGGTEPGDDGGPVRTFEASGIESFLTALDAQAGGSFAAGQIVLYPDYAVAEVRDTAASTGAASYLYREGALAALGVATLLPAAENPDAVVFTRDDVAWDAVPDLVAGSPVAAGAPEDAVSHVIVSRVNPFVGGDLVVRVYVGRGYVEYDATGQQRAVVT